MVIGKSKYSYNSGQPMQAACLLYNITGEQQYLNEAQQIARSAHNKWFTLYDSKELGEKFYRINGDHAWFMLYCFVVSLNCIRLMEEEIMSLRSRKVCCRLGCQNAGTKQLIC